MLLQISSFYAISLLLLGALPGRVLAVQILQTSSFSTCLSGSNITVQQLDIVYNNDNKTVTFNVAGASTTVQNVTAQLNVTAYGISVYQNSFNPCAESTYVQQLCPGKRPARTIIVMKSNADSWHRSTGRNVLSKWDTSYPGQLCIPNSIDSIFNSRHRCPGNIRIEGT
jgi:hypothetical protein